MNSYPWEMEVAKLLQELYMRRQLLDDSILAFQRLALSSGKRRGRPPAWAKNITQKRRGRPPGSRNKPKASAPMSALSY